MVGVECHQRGHHMVVKYQAPAVNHLHHVHFGLQNHETCGCFPVQMRSLALLVVVVVVVVGGVAVVGLLVEVLEEVARGIGL
jgi:hypothetical protein